jgi:glycosyltransferase involved in cell wall biosynthesis
MTTPTRIAFLIRSLNPGGAETQLVVLASGLVAQGCRVRVVTYYPGGPLATRLTAAGVELVSLDKLTRWDLFNSGRKLVAELREFRPNILHCFLETSNVLGALLRPLLPGTHLVWGVRSSNMEAGQYGLVWRLVSLAERLLARQPDVIVSNSQAGRRHRVALGWPAQRMRVVPNGIDTERYRPRPDVRDDVRRGLGVGDDIVLVGQVARLDPMKDHQTLLRATARLDASGRDFRLVLVGTGPKEQQTHLAEVARQLGIAGRVLWLGERLDVPLVLNALDIHVLASAYGEGFPNAVAEAMATGLPCVVTDVGDAREIVGDTGIAVPPGDPEQLAAALEGLLTTPAATRRELGQRARQRILDRYSVSRMVEDSLRLYETLVAS